MGAFRDKSGPQQGASGAYGTPDDPTISTGYPAIWEYLAEPAKDARGQLVAATLTLFLEDGLVKLCLNDRASGATAWASAGTLADAVAQMEDRLADGSVEWRRARTPQGKSR